MSLQTLTFLCFLCCVVVDAAEQRLSTAPAKVQAGVQDLLARGVALEWDMDVRVTNALLQVPRLSSSLFHVFFSVFNAFLYSWSLRFFGGVCDSKLVLFVLPAAERGAGRGGH